jgi:leader peptidase (prepilin peptidase)/N-methyltransferase
MGLGDVKFAPVLGAVVGWFGWGASIFGLLAAFVVGGMFSLALLLMGRSRRQAIPFGPFMIVGALIGLLIGSAAIEWFVAS